MGKGKGPKGMTCAQAINDVLLKDKIISSEDLFKKVKKIRQRGQRDV